MTTNMDTLRIRATEEMNLPGDSIREWINDPDLDTALDHFYQSSVLALFNDVADAINDLNTVNDSDSDSFNDLSDRIRVTRVEIR